MSYSLKQQKVLYARSFKVPTKLSIEKALGVVDVDSIIPVFRENFFETFQSLPLPKKSTDWLAQYAERGQTYAEYLQLSRTLHTSSSRHRNTIYLTLFGQINNTVVDIDGLVDYTHRFFQMPVKIIHPFIDVEWNDEKKQWTCMIALTDGKTRHSSLNTRYHEGSNHSQICVTAILNLLKKVVPNDARCLIALTMFDLYGNDTDLFIAGLAMGNCRVAAFSLYRYDPYLKFDESDWFCCQRITVTSSDIQIVERRQILLLRACRLVTHEICHLFGIAHCIFYSCLMNGSGDLEEDFGQPLFECPIDLRKLHVLINFNILKRYEQLYEFFKVHNFLDEMKMIEIKINIIKSAMEARSFTDGGIRLSNLTSIRTNLKKRELEDNTNTNNYIMTRAAKAARHVEFDQ